MAGAGGAATGGSGNSPLVAVAMMLDSHGADHDNEELPEFLRVLQRELAEVEKNKDAFLSDFTKEDYDDIVNGWNAKLKRSSAVSRGGVFHCDQMIQRTM